MSLFYMNRSAKSSQQICRMAFRFLWHILCGRRFFFLFFLFLQKETSRQPQRKVEFSPIWWTTSRIDGTIYTYVIPGIRKIVKVPRRCPTVKASLSWNRTHEWSEIYFIPLRMILLWVSSVGNRKELRDVSKNTNERRGWMKLTKSTEA